MRKFFTLLTTWAMLFSIVQAKPVDDNCEADFSYSLINTGFHFVSTSEADNGISSYQWSIDGAAYSTDSEFNYIIEDTSSELEVCLSISNADGTCSDEYCDIINSASDDEEEDNETDEPSCHANFTKSLTDSLSVQFTDISFASDSTGYSLVWDFGDGTTATDSNPSHTYAAFGEYEACLTITANDGSCSDTKCKEVDLEQDNDEDDDDNETDEPSCHANFTKSLTDSLSVQFTDISFASDSTGYSLVWDFGDGTTATDANPSHTYAAFGEYEACLTITANDGSCSDTKCKEVHLGESEEPAPTNGCHAHFHVEKDSLTVEFDNNAWGTADNVAWSWDFGDGTTATDENPIHTYAAEGQYTVCLTITADSTCNDTYCKNVVLYNNGDDNEANTYDLSGTITYANGGIAQYALVYLVKYHDLAGGLLTATDVQVIMPEDNGNYHFNHVVSGEYFVKTALIPVDDNYSTNLPTYYANALLWSDATAITVTADIEGVDIQLTEGVNDGGAGFVSGLVANGAGRSDGAIVGEGQTIIIFATDGTPVAYTFTDENGAFNVPNLPYGNYSLVADVMGLYATPYNFSITPSQSQIASVEVSVGQHASTGLAQQPLTYTAQLSPNPATDKLTLQVNFEQAQSMVAFVYNANGQAVISGVLSAASTKHQLTLDIAQLPVGVYTIELQVAGQSPIRELFLKVQ